MNHLIIILLNLEADTYFNMLQGNIAILHYEGIKDIISLGSLAVNVFG